VFGCSVRQLIEQGFQTYELMAHDYGYKRHLGACERDARNTVITRRTAHTRLRLAAAALAGRARSLNRRASR
jgi:CelD/BcsL family acetyltransferase involved in cellulose biosynthesis